MITGDFNIHLDVVDDADAIKLLGLLESIGLKQHVDIPTHISKHTVDFIITRLFDKLAVCKPWTDYLFSDRMPIHCKCKVNKPAFKRSQMSFRNIKSIDTHMLIAELQRAKRASEAPCVRKIGNPSSRENLVMTSAYERPSVRPYRLGGRGRGVSRSPIRETKECHLSFAVFCLEKSEKHSFLFAVSTNDRRG